MSCAIRECRRTPPAIDVGALNAKMQRLGAEDRVRRAAELLPAARILSSSFGAQAAVSLHLVTRVLPRIPVVLIDTGYLFAETYGFVDSLVQRLDLVLRIYRPTVSPAWLEARHGMLWEHGAAGIERYNRIH